MSTNVSEIGGNTHVVSTGANNYLWVYKNNDGKVDKGDLLVRTAQVDMSTYTHVVGNGESTYAMGDPHLNNKTYSGAEEKQVVAAFSDIFQNGAGVPSQAALANVDKAVTTVGKEVNIFDFHASMSLQLTDGTNVRYNTVIAESPNDAVATDGKSKVAYTETVDIDVTDASGKARTIRLTEIWAGNGGANQSVVKEADRRSDKDAAMPKFYEVKGANAMHGVQMYGEDAGTKKNATVVNNRGEVSLSDGQMSKAATEFYENLVRGHACECLKFALTLGAPEDDETKRQIETARNAAPAQRAAQTR